MEMELMTIILSLSPAIIILLNPYLIKHHKRKDKRTKILNVLYEGNIYAKKIIDCIEDIIYRSIQFTPRSKEILIKKKIKILMIIITILFLIILPYLTNIIFKIDFLSELIFNIMFFENKVLVLTSISISLYFFTFVICHILAKSTKKSGKDILLHSYIYLQFLSLLFIATSIWLICTIIQAILLIFVTKIYFPYLVPTVIISLFYLLAYHIDKNIRINTKYEIWDILKLRYKRKLPKVRVSTRNNKPEEGILDSIIDEDMIYIRKKDSLVIIPWEKIKYIEIFKK